MFTVNNVLYPIHRGLFIQIYIIRLYFFLQISFLYQYGSLYSVHNDGDIISGTHEDTCAA